VRFFFRGAHDRILTPVRSEQAFRPISKYFSIAAGFG